MFLSYSSENEDADVTQQPHTGPAPTQPSMPQETDGARVASPASVAASTIPPKWDSGPQEQVAAQQGGGGEEKEGDAVSNEEPAGEAENHLWATVEEKDGKQQDEEGGVTGG